MMGYRTRLGRIPKTARKDVRWLSYENVVTKEGFEDSIYYPKQHEELHELGKYCNFDDSLKGLREEFYAFNCYDTVESEFWILSKEGLKAIIDGYHKTIYSYFKSLSKLKTPEDRTEEGTTLENYFQSKLREWKNPFMLPYHLDQKHTDGAIVASWKYEYAIFNLVHIYRFFDWENDYLILSAW